MFRWVIFFYLTLSCQLYLYVIVWEFRRIQISYNFINIFTFSTYFPNANSDYYIFPFFPSFTLLSSLPLNLNWSPLNYIFSFVLLNSSFHRKLFFLRFYLFMRDTQKEADTQAGEEAGSMQGTLCGT